MRLIFSDPAWRQLSRLAQSIQQRILRKLDFYLAQDNPLEFAQPLADPRFGGWRFRIGDFRVIFDIERNTLIVLAVGHRRDIYR